MGVFVLVVDTGHGQRFEMNRIDAKFADLKRDGQTALIPFVVGGDPDLETSLRLLHALDEGGADCIELGVPFSDPMADGPTVQRASGRALKSGTTLAHVLELVRVFRRRSELPLIIFGYYNPFFHYGTRRLALEAKRSGVDGILCVDLPPEESGELKRWSDAQGLDMIFLLAPTSNAQRVRLVAREGRGFIYFVSVTGVTGARRRFESNLRPLVDRVRRYTSLPIGVGFGVSTAEQAAWVASFADAVVVGSALINVAEREERYEAKVRKSVAFVARLKQAMNRASKRPREAARV